MALMNGQIDSRAYQTKLAGILRDIFGKEMVKTEWDSVRFDGHFGNHHQIYAPRHDIAVGPFNSYADLDIGNDQTKAMLKHPFTKKIIKTVLNQREKIDKIWNSFSRCFLAIEIEFSGSEKHMLGSIINASVSGSIGIVISNHANIEKVKRLSKYILRLEGLEQIELNSLRNLVIFEQEDFIYFLKAKNLPINKSPWMLFLESVSGKRHGLRKR
jgi:hypothetical protein